MTESRFSMEWFHPVLSGTVTCTDARQPYYVAPARCSADWPSENQRRLRVDREPPLV
jgi:hypothetical protein